MIHRKPQLPVKLLFATLALAASPVHGASVFADNFEAGTAGIISQQSVTATADVLTYNVVNTSRVFNDSIWVDTTVGFGADRNGLIDGGAGGTDFGNFTPDGSGPQAYAFRYTNSGLTSGVGVIGSLTLGTTITVSFDVFLDGWDYDSNTEGVQSGSAYEAYITTFNGGTRVDMDDGGAIQGTTSMLAKLTGIAAGTSYQTVSFSYTVGGDVWDADGDGGAETSLSADQAFSSAVLGHDIAIRFDGATSRANIDNVSVDISAIPEPCTALLGGLGLLALLRRRR